jgi:cytochrome c-type biogenesis protein CcmH
MKYLATLAFLASLIAFPAAAVIETYEFSDEGLELRYHELSSELRCPKCQNQNIADSNAPIAKDLRATLYQQLEAGASDREILDYMVARYGEFVRYRPSFSGATAVLWFAPVLLLLAGVVVLLLTLRNRRKPEVSGAGSGLSAEEARRVEALLQTSEKDA